MKKKRNFTREVWYFDELQPLQRLTLLEAKPFLAMTDAQIDAEYQHTTAGARRWMKAEAAKYREPTTTHT